MATLMRIAGRTQVEYYNDNKDKRKEYIINNKDNIKQSSKLWYEKHKYEISEKYNQEHAGMCAEPG